MSEETVLIEQYSKVEHFIKENRKSVSIIVGGTLVLVAAYFGYQKFVVAPKETEAAGQMFTAERYFQQDSLKKALNGDGNFPGFETIAEDYSGTKAGNLANYYAGICQLRLGKFEEAIEKLEDFTTSDDVLASVALGATGDAYSELNNSEKAINYYQKAADKGKNDLTSPVYLMKAATLYEASNETEKALDIYKQIQSDYYESQEGREVEKYISRAQAKLGK